MSRIALWPLGLLKSLASRYGTWGFATTGRRRAPPAHVQVGGLEVAWARRGRHAWWRGGQVRATEGGEKALRLAAHAPRAPPQIGCPITRSFPPHAGPVLGVSASPLVRNLFASCGADGTVRVQSTAHGAPVR